MLVSAQTQLLGVLGHPIEHSLSPLIHNTALQAVGFDAVYTALRVAPENLTSAFQGLRALGFLGVNVTLPHKSRIFELVDSCSDTARNIGAVNTVVFQRHDGAVHAYGDNTDVEGFLSPLESYEAELQGSHVVVLGSGGAARAVIYAVLTRLRPRHLVLLARTTSKAEKLALDMAPFDATGALDVAPIADGELLMEQARLVVNATPAGMAPHEDRTPWHGSFQPGQLVYDLVYNPQKTLFLRNASDQGATTIGGLDMLISQAAASFSQWTGKTMPTTLIRDTLTGIFTNP